MLLRLGAHFATQNVTKIVENRPQLLLQSKMSGLLSVWEQAIPQTLPACSCSLSQGAWLCVCVCVTRPPLKSVRLAPHCLQRRKPAAAKRGAKAKATTGTEGDDDGTDDEVQASREASAAAAAAAAEIAASGRPAPRGFGCASREPGFPQAPLTLEASYTYAQALHVSQGRRVACPRVARLHPA